MNAARGVETPAQPKRIQRTRAKDDEKSIPIRVIYREDAKRTEELLIWLLQLSRSGAEL